GYALFGLSVRVGGFFYFFIKNTNIIFSQPPAAPCTGGSVFLALKTVLSYSLRTTTAHALTLVNACADVL
ncbi:hypothetical protein, partial [Pseudomonas atacamensis]|uniref:hypothetical protein n=1 Tax=Pseudomonas atacamensis TaxID=2565368 RepID=UPI00320BB275